MASGDIIIRWVSDSAAAVRDTERMNRALGDSATKSEKWGRRLRTAANIGTAAMAALVPVAWKAINAASDQEQAFGALDSVFKQYADRMRDASKAGVELGLSTTQYATQATLLGAQLQNLGFTTQDATDQTEKLMVMAADMAAQFGGSTAEAVESLSSALRGERDPIEKYAISLNETAIKAKMAEENLTKTEAAIAIIEEQLKKSGTVGTAAKEYDTFAASTQRLKASWENFMATLGSGETEDGVNIINDLTDALNGVSKWIEDNPTAFKFLSRGIMAVVGALVALKAALAVIGPLKSLLGLIKRFPKASGIGILIGLIVALYNSLKDVSAGASGALGSLRRFWDITAPFKGGWWVTDMLNTLKNALSSVGSWISSTASKLSGLISLMGRVPGLGGRANAPGVPNFQGVTPRRVEQATSSPPTFNVYVAGQRVAARTEPVSPWQPRLTLGVM